MTFGADGTLSGSDGCNQFNTTYTEDGDSLTVNQPGASTMMACEDAVMAQATAFMTALAATTTFSVADGQLALSDGSQTLATFDAASSDLTDTAWDVVNYNNGREAVVGMLVDTEVTAYFDAEGMVTGNAGCNQYFAEYSADGNAIAIGMPGVSMRFCPEPEGVMDQETEYLAALQSAATYSIRGDMLEMRTAADQMAVLMTRRAIVDLPEPAPEPSTPTGVVTGAQALNIRTGPGTAFPVIGVARNGDVGEIVGRSADGNWWVVSVPSAPGGVGWVSASFVTATNADDVPVVASPPLPPHRRRGPCRRRRFRPRPRCRWQRQPPRSRSGPTGQPSIKGSAPPSTGPCRTSRRFGYTRKARRITASRVLDRATRSSARPPRRRMRCVCKCVMVRPSSAR